MPHPDVRATLHVGPQGRVVIPSELRDALAIHPGDTLLARLTDEGSLLLETREQVLARLRREASKVRPGVNLAAELIAERREEARREFGEITGSRAQRKPRRTQPPKSGLKLRNGNRRDRRR